tara:strand:- start:2076 stop:5024 length:2949 start_codon:yes stop_codon:yes gene_type:complete
VGQIKEEIFKIEPFNNLTDKGKEIILQNIDIVSFGLGEQLIDENTIPGRILIILNGSARNLIRENGKLKNFRKYEYGSIIGAASVMSGYPVENYSAGEGLVAFLIEEEIWKDLYQVDQNFKSWCNTNLWIQEVLYLITKKIEAFPKELKISFELIEKIYQKSKLLNPNIKNFKRDDMESNYLFNLTFADKKSDLTRPISNLKESSLSQDYSNRILSVPKDLIDSLFRVSNKIENLPNEFNTIKSNRTPNQNLFESPRSTNRIQSDITKEINLIRAEGLIEETFACLKMLTKFFKIPLRQDAVFKTLNSFKEQNIKISINEFAQLLSNLGLQVNKTKILCKDATRLIVPALIPWGKSFAIISQSNKDGITLLSPGEGKIHIKKELISLKFDSYLDCLIPERVRITPQNIFGFKWFIPELKRYRIILMQVLFSSFIVQLFTLANPLIIQVIIDKVISQRSLDTLQVLGIALLVLTLIEGLLASLRTFLLTETTNRIDQKLGSQVIDHLFKLPLEYFDSRPVGELSTRVGELEKIRNFITGQGITIILDALLSIVYIFVMLLYSVKLTFIALIVIPIQVGITYLGAPIFRRQFRESAEKNAKTQSHLVEVLTGIQTVKSQNIEMISRWKWQELYSKYIGATFKKIITGTLINQSGQMLQKISQLLVLWFGATMVLNGKLTLGQLIAFRIISGFVTQPILRLTNLWQSVQELKVGFERLGDVINTNKESDDIDKGKISLPSIYGNIKFENLSFNFPKQNQKILNNINLEIEKGSFIGIVGKSGSGKSTLMKLLARLYSPSHGKILIGDYDIDKVELYSLRSQIGIVPQEPLLFSGTIRDNICINQENATDEEIINASKIACADKFIMEMSEGYNTTIGERGASISGGQKQRIAIARTILAKPKLIVLDEATSALDYETEANVFNNIDNKFKNSTIFCITHRIPTVMKADQIIFLQNGAIIEKGTHEQLIANEGKYFSLYKKQKQGI